MIDGPSEIASWVFPHEPEEDEKRIALAAEIDKLIEASAAWRRSAPIRCSSLGENDGQRLWKSGARRAGELTSGSR
jgi:hypothetical protein